MSSLNLAEAQPAARPGQSVTPAQSSPAVQALSGTDSLTGSIAIAVAREASESLFDSRPTWSPTRLKESAGMLPVTLGVQSSSGSPSAPVSLALNDAVQRALQKNLGVLLEEQEARLHDGRRRQALADVLPNVSAVLARGRETFNPAAFGFPGPLIGPFNFIDARVSYWQSLMDLPALHEGRMESALATAAGHSYKHARDLVVLSVAQLYFQVGVAQGQLATAMARAGSAEAVLAAADRRALGDSLPGRIRLQADRQRVVALQATLTKQKLALAQAIGLPRGQQFTLSDQIPYAPLRLMTLEDALERAYRDRADFRAQLAQVEAAEAKRRSASSERLPTVGIRADIGRIGQEPPFAKRTFTLRGVVHMPIIGGETRGDVLEADSELRQEKARLEALQDAIYYEIQNALIDVQAAEEQVGLAGDAVQLAKEQVAQSKDRVAALTPGAAFTPLRLIAVDRADPAEPGQGGDSDETLDPQGPVAAANDNYISSLYAFNVAKLTFARAIGVAEEAYMQFLTGTF